MNRKNHFFVGPSGPECVYVTTDLLREQIESTRGVLGASTLVGRDGCGCYKVYLDPRYDSVETIEELRAGAKALYDEQLAFVIRHVPEMDSMGWYTAYKLACERDAATARRLAMEFKPGEERGPTLLVGFSITIQGGEHTETCVTSEEYPLRKRENTTGETRLREITREAGHQIWERINAQSMISDSREKFDDNQDHD